VFTLKAAQSNDSLADDVLTSLQAGALGFVSNSLKLEGGHRVLK
jgi:hypothetical protein